MENRFQELTASSKNALEWAFTRAQHRASFRTKSPQLFVISSVDLLVGVFLAHPDNSPPLLLLQHFHIPPDQFYKLLRSEGSFEPNNPPSTPERLSQIPSLDEETEKILEESFSLSAQFNPETDRLVRHRDLFGGILNTPCRARDLLRQCLSDGNVPFDQFVSAYPEYLKTRSGELPFSKFLGDRFPVQRPSEPAQTQESLQIHFSVSGFSADTRGEKEQKDLIGIGAEVDAFAYLIAAKALQPPMAIGLFGDWGAGKSFFMEALRERIHKITADAQHSGLPQSRISVHKYIAQIEFNAWHYVEGELWASLVEHIFRNLKTGSDDPPDLLQERQKVLIDKLESARQEQKLIQATKRKLENQLSETKARVDQLKVQREIALKNLNEMKAIDILQAVKLTEEEKKAISGPLNDLGFTEAYNSVAEFQQAVDQLHTVLERGNALTTPLRERGWKWAVGLIIVAFIGPVISLILSQLKDVPVLTNGLASFSAFLGGLTIMLKQGTFWLSGALAKVETAQQQLDAKRRAVEANYADRIAKAEQQYNQKVEEHEKAKEEEKEKARQIEELEKELKQLTPGRVLLDFISERVGSQDYRKYLGVAALIRNDFEQLSKLIVDNFTDFVKTDDGVVPDKPTHEIHRIVLYIDDLDRCPPDRVVKVLQAVHLLLAFPLFVVVVAVDARWLSQSLMTHYQNLLTTDHLRDGLEKSEEFGQQASPQDYLEKIFQIPFWVRPLPEKARMRIVQGLVEESLVPASSETTVSSQEHPAVAQESGNDGQNVNGDGKISVVHWESSERRRPLDQEVRTDLKPPSLDIQPIELQFMEGLRSLLGETPRSVKRFVNIYRLIKAVSLDQSTSFVKDEPFADFKQVLFLLAVLTGLPAISREFFRLLHSQRSEVERTQISDQERNEQIGCTISQILDALREEVMRGTDAFRSNALVDEQPKITALDPAQDRRLNEYENWDTFRQMIRLETWLKQHDHGLWLQADVTALADWTPQVARYSYRIEEL
jgi:hypothetical protein